MFNFSARIFMQIQLKDYKNFMEKHKSNSNKFGNSIIHVLKNYNQQTVVKLSGRSNLKSSDSFKTASIHNSSSLSK